MNKLHLNSKIVNALTILCLFSISFYHTQAQVLTWIPKTSFTPGNRYAPHGFTIGNTGYVGGGLFYNGSSAIPMNDLWAYDPNLDTWTQKANIPTNGRYAATAYELLDNGYVLLGHNLNNYLSDQWKYNPVLNQWVQVASFPGAPRYTSASFVIGSNAYVGMGKGSGTSVYNDFYKYDPINNNWNAKSSLPAAARQNPVGFEYQSKGYLLGGVNESTNSNYSDMWEYDTTGNFWSYVSTFPGTASFGHMSFEYNNKRYIGCGANLNSGQTIITDQFYSYDFQANIWTPENNFVGGPRSYGLALEIGTKVFMGFGKANNTPSGYLSDWWELWDLTGFNEFSSFTSRPKLYFNKISNSIIVEFDDKVSSKYSLKVFDLKGREIQQGLLDKFEKVQSFEVITDKEQVYLVTLESDNFESFSYRLFISR